MDFYRPAILSTAILLAMSGCGGGDNGGVNTGGPGSGDDSRVGQQNQTLLKGTAAAGAPIIGTVVVKGSKGGIVSRQIEANGNYSVDVSELTAPYMLRASGTVGGRGYTLHSFAEAADIGKTVNITPFTDLIVANAAGQVARDYFESGDFSTLTPEKIAVEEEALQNKLQSVFTELGVEDTIDLLHTSFSANHTRLDAALDIVRVEVNAESNIATLTNVIDNTTLLDSISDDSQDQSGTLQVVSNLNTVEGDMEAITQRFAELTTKFTTGLPSASDLEPFFAANFSSDDQDRRQFLTDITTDPDLVGLRFEGVAISNLDHEAGTADISVQIRTSERALDAIDGWKIKKQGETWKILGDQRIAEVLSSFQCIHSENDPADIEYGCDLNIDIRDGNPDNNQGLGKVRSARITLQRKGEPVSGTVIYAGEGQGSGDPSAQSGELALFDSDYNDDAISLGGNGGLSPSLFKDNDSARIALFTAPLTVTGGVASVTGDPIATYDIPIPKAPLPMAKVSSHAYPAISSATKTTLQAFTGGDLTVSWTLPTNSGLRNEQVLFIACDADGDCVNEEKWKPAGTSVTFNGIDLTSSGVDKAPIGSEIRVYSIDEFGREFTAVYHTPANGGDTTGTGDNGNGNTGGTPQMSIDLTKLGGTTVYEVFFDNEQQLGCKAPKSLSKLEFLTDDSFRYTGIVGEEAGNSAVVNFTPSANRFDYASGETTTFTETSGQPYFMTGNWVSADKKEQDLNYYFTTEQAASSFVLPGCSR